MKVFIPQNIEKWRFSHKFDFGFVRVSMLQLFIIAFWVAIALSIWSKLLQAWLDKLTSFIIVSPIIVLTLVIAFFNISELWLIPFILKILRTYFFDVPKRFYNIKKDVLDYKVLIYKNKLKEEKKKVEYKEFKIDKQKLEKLKKFSF